jgi:NAD(P)-dependent dehydrogenase (short-subunit alcohol dehydrogenase family)
MQKAQKKKKQRPEQHQNKQPGLEHKLKPLPEFFDGNFTKGFKLKDKVCIITGGDSGIGKAVAVSFAREGAIVVIAYLDEKIDAQETAQFITENFSAEVLMIGEDIRTEKSCKKIIHKVVKTFGRIDVLVNNAAVQYDTESIEDLKAKELEKVFEVNVFSMYYLVKHALPYMAKGSSIINTSSVTAYRGSGHLLHYSASKGAIISFTRSLSANLAPKGIRVNAVAPGPVWTPLIAASVKAKKVATFGSDTPLGRAGEPFEIAPCYVFLASEDAAYMTGQVLHPNGGEIVNG